MVQSQMVQSQKLYEYIKERTWELTERWYATLDKNGKGIYSSTEPQVIAQLRQQNHVFHEKFVELFNASNKLFIENFDDFVTTISLDEGHQQTPLTEITEEFFRQQYLYLEMIEEFTQLYPTELNTKQIFAYHRSIIETINNVILRFSDEFIKQAEKRLIAHQEMIIELSAPIIELTDKTAVLPLVGEVDTNRAKIMLEQSLKQCAEAQIRHLYIDLSGVPVVDTMVAQQLFLMVDALSLIGVTSSLSGIRPSIAQTTIQLGIDFSNIETYSTLEKALRKSRVTA